MYVLVPLGATGVIKRGHVSHTLLGREKDVLPQTFLLQPGLCLLPILLLLLFTLHQLDDLHTKSLFKYVLRLVKDSFEVSRIRVEHYTPHVRGDSRVTTVVCTFLIDIIPSHRQSLMFRKQHQTRQCSSFPINILSHQNPNASPNPNNRKKTTMKRLGWTKMKMTKMGRRF